MAQAPGGWWRHAAHHGARALPAVRARAAPAHRSSDPSTDDQNGARWSVSRLGGDSRVAGPDRALPARGFRRSGCPCPRASRSRTTGPSSTCGPLGSRRGHRCWPDTSVRSAAKRVHCSTRRCTRARTSTTSLSSASAAGATSTWQGRVSGSANGERVVSAGLLADRDASLHLQACDVMIQPYVDGASARRTTLMAALAHGRAIVTTIGSLSGLVDDDRMRSSLSMSRVLTRSAMRR